LPWSTHFPHRPDEAKPFPGGRLYVPLVLAAVADGDPGGLDQAGQRRYRNDPAVPDGVDHLILGHGAATVGDEKSEYGEDLRLNGDRPIRLRQCAAIREERVVFECIAAPSCPSRTNFYLVAAKLERNPPFATARWASMNAYVL
jgi:hypothetical protein